MFYKSTFIVIPLYNNKNVLLNRNINHYFIETIMSRNITSVYSIIIVNRQSNTNNDSDYYREQYVSWIVSLNCTIRYLLLNSSNILCRLQSCYTFSKLLQLPKARINSGDNQKIKLDKIPENEFNCVGFRKKAIG